MKKKVITIVVICAAVVALGAAGWLYLQNMAGQAAQELEVQPVPVSVTKPETEDLTNSMEFIGTVASGNSVNVIPKLTAKVKEIRVKPGDSVKKGDVLFTMDTVDLQSQIDLAGIALESAQISYELTTGTTLNLQEDQAYLSYKAAKDTYEDSEEAYDDLIGNKREIIKQMQAQIAIDKKTYEDKVIALSGQSDPAAGYVNLQTEYRVALAAWQANPTDNALKVAYEDAKDKLEQVDALRTAYLSSQSSLATYQSSVAQAEAGLDATDRSYNAAKLAYESVTGESREAQEKLAALQLKQAQTNFDSVMTQVSNAQVTAPVDGTVLALSVRENEYASQQSAAAVVGGTSAMEVTFGLPDRFYTYITPGDLVNISHAGKNVAAAITEISPMVDPRTGLFSVKASFDNSETSMLSGAMAKVEVTTEKAESALTVPASCVRHEENKPYIYIARDGVAVKTFLTLGITDETVYQVLDGLSATDSVIATWHPNLADGVSVAVN